MNSNKNVRNLKVARSLKIKSNVKAGIIVICKTENHNQTLMREAKKNLRVKTNVKAGLKLGSIKGD